MKTEINMSPTARQLLGRFGLLLALLVIQRRPVPVGAVVHADEVGGNTAVVVAIGLAVLHW